MKKILAVLMAIAMLCSLSVSAVAATATTENVLNWNDIEAGVEAKGIDASFVQIGDLNLMMWLPSIFSEQELTEEDIRDGYISYMTTDDESAAVAIMRVDIDMSLEEFEKELPDYGVTDAEMGIVNGFMALMYSVPESDTMCLDFEVDSGEILQFIFCPMSDEGYQELAGMIMASIQPME